MSEARVHAVTASTMLENVDHLAERLRTLTPEDRLQMVASGEFSRINADQKWTVDLAFAHALTAIALVITEPDGDDPLL